MLSKSEARGASKKPRSKAAIAAVHPPGGITKPFLTKEELGIMLNISPRTIENWMHRRRIPYLKIGKRTRRFNLARVEAALSRFEVKEVGR
jgi:excisionase family DNA binding protein